MTVPHYHPTYTLKPWPEPWKEAIGKRAYNPATRNWLPGCTIVGGRLWVRCDLYVRCGS